MGVCYDTIENYMAIRWNQKIVLHSSVESPDELFMRVSGFYDDILPNLEGKNILIVAHSGIARMSYFYKQGRPTGGDYTNFEIKNSHVLKIDN